MSGPWFVKYSVFTLLYQLYPYYCLFFLFVPIWCIVKFAALQFPCHIPILQFHISIKHPKQMLGWYSPSFLGYFFWTFHIPMEYPSRPWHTSLRRPLTSTPWSSNCAPTRPCQRPRLGWNRSHVAIFLLLNYQRVSTRFVWIWWGLMGLNGITWWLPTMIALG